MSELLIEQRVVQALRQICERLSDLDRPWAVTGSVGLALQGVAVETHDVDIQTDAAGAYQIGALLAGGVVEPVRFVQSEGIRSHFGRFELAGCEIEVMGDIEKWDGTGWVKPPDLPQIIRVVRFEDRVLPVLDMGYELTAYRALKRTATVAAIEATLADG